MYFYKLIKTLKIKRFKKIAKRIVLAIILLLVLLVGILSIPAVQNSLAQRATKYINKKYNVSIVISKIDISNLKDIHFENVVVNDHHDFPFIKVKKIKTSILNVKKIIDNKLNLGEVFMDKLDFVQKTYKNENQDNISIFTDKFNTRDENEPYVPFILTSKKMSLSNSSYYFYDLNKQQEPIVYYNNIQGEVQDFNLHGKNIFGLVRDISFIDNHNIEVIDFDTDFTYTPEQMNFKNTFLKTKTSQLQTNMVFNYKETGLKDFNNNVKIIAEVTKADISLKDLHHFYNELGTKDVIHFTTTLDGVLNDFVLKKLQLKSDNNSIINGNIHFLNAINREKGFALDSDIKKLVSDYDNLVSLLPNLLGKTLPTNFKMFGKFNLKGKSYITTKKVDAQLEIDSQLGKSISDLLITNIDNIDNASYKGKIQLIDFKLGKVIKDSLVRDFSMVADVDGKGFTKETLNTSLKGHISKHQYKGYTYTNIDVNGLFKNQHFEGELIANDPNIKMDFKGLADLKDNKYVFKFVADVDYADFYTLNLFTKHNKSILKGKINFDVSGTTIDNVIGNIHIKDASYTNEIDTYSFKNFEIHSSFKDSVRAISIDSKDIVEGRLVGKFKFNELLKLSKNAMASIYTHYQPEVVEQGQFLNFNFKIYDKIIGVFYPKIKVAKNTFVKGKIGSDNEKFELLFKSPKIEAYQNIIDKIRLQIDNKNPLYNTILSIKKVDSKSYNIANLNLVNITLNDTLFMQTNFVGGKKLTENFNLSLYHTINKENKSIVGFKKSEIYFKGLNWLINPNNDKLSKVIFDRDFNNFVFKPIEAISGVQKMNFFGEIKNKNNKNLHLTFDNILLDRITPEVENFDLKGILDGKFDYTTINSKTLPKVDLKITEFMVNGLSQGDLILKSQMDKSFKKYDFRATIQDLDERHLDAFGIIDFSKENNLIDATLVLNKLQLSPLNPLGGENITNIRGLVSGSTKLKGLLKNPNMLGELYLDKAGLTFPYLNVDYHLKNPQQITVFDQTFDFNTTTIVDSEKETEGTLTGTITHQEFKKWFLDLNIDADNLLVLNTKEKEESLYYGAVYIEGGGTIKGPTDELVIDVEAKTNPNTEFIVPLSDINTIEDNKLVHFVSEVDKTVKDTQRPDEIVFKQKGLTLNIFLEVTPDALAGIVIDKATGSYLKGRGDAYLDININTTGKFEMIGTYVVKEGKYVLKNYVSKEFDVVEGGKIYWNGSPFDAYLDIVAVSKVRANPSIILENVQSSRDIDINLVTKITGNLYEPKMEFDIVIPNASSIVKSELAFKLNSDDKKMYQFFSLLSFGTFTDTENADFANSGSALLKGTISEKISSVLNNILSSKDDKFRIGFNYEAGDENKLKNIRTDDQVGVTLQTKIFKKIILNGVVGVPVNSNSQSTVTGELEAELPLNKEGNFRAKAYNRRNEIEFDALDNEGYTQGIGISYQVNFDSGRELLEKMGILKTKQEKEKLKKKRDSIQKLKSKKLVNFVQKKDTIK